MLLGGVACAGEGPMSEPTVSVALVGTRRPEEMEENAAAADWELSSEEREEIRVVVTG